jgi:hypothetical protein
MKWVISKVALPFCAIAQLDLIARYKGSARWGPLLSFKPRDSRTSSLNPLELLRMAVSYFLTILATSAAMFVGVYAETHTVTFDNRCRYGTVG